MTVLRSACRDENSTYEDMEFAFKPKYSSGTKNRP